MRWVTDQYDIENRTSAISDQEMVDLVKQHLPKEYAKAKEQGRLMEIANF